MSSGKTLIKNNIPTIFDDNILESIKQISKENTLTLQSNQKQI